MARSAGLSAVIMVRTERCTNQILLTGRALNLDSRGQVLFAQVVGSGDVR
jgi:hypothetical protein